MTPTRSWEATWPARSGGGRLRCFFAALPVYGPNLRVSRGRWSARGGMKQQTRKSLLVAGITLAAVVAIASVLLWKGGLGILAPHSEQALARRAQTFWDMKVAGDTM